MPKEPLLVHFELFIALLIGDALGLLEVHADRATALSLAVGSAEHVLLHLLCVDTLGDGFVPLAIVAVKAGLDPTFLLGASSRAESVSEDVLTLDGRYVALVAWDAADHLRVVLLLTVRGLGQCVSLALLSDLSGLVASVSWQILSLCWAVLHLGIQN